MWIDDNILKNCGDELHCAVWQPAAPLVVIGNSNTAARECCVGNCRSDGVEILQRYGGGGAVVLYPGCIVVSLGTWVKDYYENSFYFEKLNGAVAACLEKTWSDFSGIQQDGLSDLTVGGKKFAGTSLFRSRNYLLYQASLIVDLDTALISRYLQHPSKEPGYRAGRRHEDFLVGLRSLQPAATVAAVLNLLNKELVPYLKGTLSAHLIAPKLEQTATLFKRAANLDQPAASLF